MTVSDVIAGLSAIMTAQAGCIIWVYSLVAKERAARERLAEDYHQFRERTAREFVTVSMMERLEERVAGSIDRLADRLDRILEAKIAPGRALRRAD